LLRRCGAAEDGGARARRERGGSRCSRRSAGSCRTARPSRQSAASNEDNELVEGTSAATPVTEPFVARAPWRPVTVSQAVTAFNQKPHDELICDRVASVFRKIKNAPPPRKGNPENSV